MIVMEQFLNFQNAYKLNIFFFMNIIEKFSLNQAFMPKTACDCLHYCQCLTFSLCVTQKEHSPTATVNLASDWLGVDLEVRSLCYWSIPQTGNQRTEEE